MKLLLLFPLLLALPACTTTGEGLPASFTLGLSGRTTSGQDWTLGLTVPLTKKAPAPVITEPPLPEEFPGKSPLPFVVE